MHDDQRLVGMFERACLRTRGPASVVLFGPEAVGSLPWANPAWVLTAHNPQGVRASDEQNVAVHLRLVAHVRDLGLEPVVIEAGGPDWVEDSLLVPGDTLDPDVVFDLARRFDQHSVFELTDERIRIVRVRDREVLSDRPRT